MFLITIMAVGLTVSEIDKGQRSERSDHNEIDYNSLKCNIGLYSLHRVS